MRPNANGTGKRHLFYPGIQGGVLVLLAYVLVVMDGRSSSLMGPRNGPRCDMRLSVAVIHELFSCRGRGVFGVSNSPRSNATADETIAADVQLFTAFGQGSGSKSCLPLYCHRHRHCGSLTSDSYSLYYLALEGRFELDAVSGWLRLHGCRSRQPLNLS